MDHALRVNHHFDLVGRRTEQPVRLDHFQALVHHGRRVNRNLPAHRPFGMRHRLLRRHCRQLLDRSGAKRPSRGRKEHAPDPAPYHVARVAVRHRLENRIVLAVDRQQQRTGTAHLRHEYFPGHHKRFLVGKQDPLSCARRSQCWRQAGSTDDRGHHRIDFWQRRDPDQGLGTVKHLSAQTRIAQQCGKAGGLRSTTHHCVSRTKLTALGCENLDLAVPREGGNLEAIRMACNYVEGAGTDRTRGAQDGKFHGRTR